MSESGMFWGFDCSNCGKPIKFLDSKGIAAIRAEPGAIANTRCPHCQTPGQYEISTAKLYKDGTVQ